MTVTRPIGVLTERQTTPNDNKIGTLAVGERIVVTREINLAPLATIAEGERGTTAYVGPDGYTEIKMDKHHPGLNEYDNCIWIIPPEAGGETSEVERSIARTKQEVVLYDDPDTCASRSWWVQRPRCS